MKGVHQRSCSPGHTNTGYNCSTYHCSSLKPKPWLPRPKELPCPKGSSKDKKALAKRATLSKGSSGKNAKAQAKAKAKALTKGKTKVKKSFLKKNQLAKPGKMTLAQKIAKAAENAETGEEAANNLKAMLNSNEHSRVWSKHNVMMKNNKPQKERNAFDKLSKGEKGMQAALFMIKGGVPKFFHTSQSIKQGTTLDKREKWESETRMIELHGWDDLQKQVASGRIQWRADPWTPGVYNYCDKGDLEKHTKVTKSRSWTKGQEYEPNEEDNAKWGQVWTLDEYTLLTQVENWGKGGGKGKPALAKGKGKGKGKKGKGKAEVLAIMDGDPWEDEDGQEEQEEEQEETESEEVQWKKLIVKAKRARDQVTSTKADLEAALDAADHAKMVTKTAKKEVTTLLDKMGSQVNVLKTLLVKQQKSMSLTKAKDLLVEVGTLMKDGNDECKELTQLANKAGSKASKR